MHDDLIREIESIFGEMVSLLNEKEKKIVLLLEEADRKIKLLESLLKESLEEDCKDDFLHSELGNSVIDMYKRGLDVRTIAMKLGAHQGEVELIINLYRTKYESSSNRDIR